MLEILRKISGGSRPATAAQLREALAEIDKAALAADVAAAEVEFKEAVLSGDEKRLDKAEASLADARRDLERGQAAVEALTEKIVETDKAEADAALKAEHDEIDNLAETVARDLARIYPKASSEIIAILERLDEVERRIDDFNRRMLSSDAPVYPQMKRAEERVFPTPSGNLQGITSVLRLTELRPVRGTPGWGQSRVLFETLGGKL